MTRYDYGLMLNKIEAAFRDCDVADVDAGDVLDLREQWRTRPRSANKYQSLLSLLMAFAIVKRQRTTNPTWRRARERGGITDVRYRDLRPKALSDALRNGLSPEKIKDGAGHASVTTTEDYMRGFEVKEAALGLALPKAKKSV